MSKFAKDQVALQFSRAARTYDTAAQLQTEMAKRLIEAIPSDATGELVDLGCGTGWALQQISALKRFKLTAVDLAPGMIEVAKSRVPNANLLCRDLEETGLPTKQADVVFSNAAIQWCDTRAAFAEIKRITKTNGLLVCSTFGPLTMREIRAAWQESGDGFDRVHQFETCQTIESLFGELGFKKVKVESELQALKFDSVKELLQSIKNLGATNASSARQTGLMGTSRYRKFCNVLEDRLACDGHLKLTFDCIFASARVE